MCSSVVRIVFFFKQKTAYEMRISDWSSDVCSSDLRADAEIAGRVPATVFIPPPRVESALVRLRRLPVPRVDADPDRLFRLVKAGFGQRRKIGRASCRERVCQYV